MKKHITIKQAQKYFPRSHRWYLNKIYEGKIKTASEGKKGSTHLIEVESLEKYIDTISAPMSV